MKRSFAQSKDAGSFAEGLLRNLLSSADIPNNLNTAKNKSVLAQWDVQASLDGITFTIEVKFDQMECRTSNIAVEYYNTRQAKPSGILATRADLWCFVLQNPTTVWLARTDDLRYYFHREPCKKEIACGGDGNAAMKLYERDVLFDALFYRVDGLSPAGLVNVLKNLLVNKSAETARLAA